MKQTTIVAIVLGVLVLISVAQAFQLSVLKTRIREGQTSVSSSSIRTAVTTSGGSSGRTATLPSSVQNLPKMVGGC